MNQHSEGHKAILWLQSLGGKLRQAKAEENSRTAALKALEALIDFINQFEDFDLENLGTPLVILHSAVQGLNDGRVDEILTPTEFGNRPPESDLVLLIKGTAIVLVGKLKGQGFSVQDACRVVAKGLRASGFQFDGRAETADWKKVKYWRDGISRPKAQPKLLELVTVLDDKFSLPGGQSRDQITGRVFAVIKSVVEPYRRALRKPPR